MSKVVPLHAKGSADHALESAKGRFEDVLIMGYDHDGDLIVFSSEGMTKVADINYLVDYFKKALFSDYFETESPEEDDGH